MSFGEALTQIAEISRRMDSHLFADIAGWHTVTPWSEVMLTVLTERVLNLLRSEGDKPISLPRPWEAPAVPVSEITPEERDELRAQLIRRSAFRDQ